MSATMLFFPDRPLPSAKVIPLPSTRDLALENLRRAYQGARKGNPRARETVDVYAKYAGDEEVARLAQMLVADLERGAVVAPCDSGDVA